MIIFGHYNRDRREDTGSFACPQCARDSEFALIRTWKYFHLYFIPVARHELVAEKIVCQQCGAVFPITVLAGSANDVMSAFDAGNAVAQSISDNIGNIVQFTDAAVAEILQRHARGQFDNDVVVRVEPGDYGPRVVRALFDFALADGRDWIGQSHGIPVVVDRVVAPELHGATIDFDDGEFVRTVKVASN